MDAANVYFYGMLNGEVVEYDAETAELDSLGSPDSAIPDIIDRCSVRQSPERNLDMFSGRTRRCRGISRQIQTEGPAQAGLPHGIGFPWWPPRRHRAVVSECWPRSAG